MSGGEAEQSGPKIHVSGGRESKKTSGARRVSGDHRNGL